MTLTSPHVTVLHLIDSLELGGAERVAVNIANALPSDQYKSYLCATRAEGPLVNEIAPHVQFLSLGRNHRFDALAVIRLLRYVNENCIQLIHAHGTSVFLASIISLLCRVPIVWHDHYGPAAINTRPVTLYRFISGRISAIIAVNDALVLWARTFFPVERINYIPNFILPSSLNVNPLAPSKTGNTIVCVANLRPQKDHLTLIRAISIAIKSEPRIKLLLVGSTNDVQQVNDIKDEISRNGLENNVTIMGQRTDVQAILQYSDIGILSSASEGLPMALLEYGAARLPVISTRVGQCAEVLDNGRAGILVDTAVPEQLAKALIHLLKSPHERSQLGSRLYERVTDHYSPKAVVRQICAVYETVLPSTTI